MPRTRDADVNASKHSQTDGFQTDGAPTDGAPDSTGVAEDSSGTENRDDARSHGAIAQLLQACQEAIARRAEIEWPGRDLAEAALAAAAQGRVPDADVALTARLMELALHTELEAHETGLLIVAIAADLDPNLHLLLGLLAGDEAPARPTVALGFELTELSPLSTQARTAVAELGSLRRYGLTRVEGSTTLLTRRLIAPDRVVAHLLGDDFPPEILVPLICDPAPVDLPGTDTVAAALREGREFVWVQSPPGAAGTALAAAACRAVDVPCFFADLRRLPGVSEAGRSSTGDAEQVAAAVDALLLEATLNASVLLLAGAELAADVMSRLAYPAVPVIAVGSTPWDPLWEPQRLPLSVVAARTDIATRAALWSPLLGSPDGHTNHGTDDHGIDDDGRDHQEDDVRATAALRLTPEEIARVGQAAVDEAALEPDGVVDAERVRRAARRLGRNRSSKVASSMDSATLDDLVLPDHTRREVSRLLDWARYRDEVLAQGPLQGKGGKGSGICALFSGSPGTGKSLAAHVVADTLGMDLYSVDISSMVDKYVGETEKNLERVFTEAESLNAVLFFDEADSLFGSRSEVKDAHDRYANQEVAYLLQRMEQFDGITILATNLRGNIDPAFSRRLHFMIHFPDPDNVTARRLWEYHLANVRDTDADDPVDVDVLARDLVLSGGDIRNVVLSAAYQAAAERSGVAMRHVAAAVAREYSKLGRRVPARSWIHEGSAPDSSAE